MAKKEESSLDKLEKAMDDKLTFNPLLQMLRENDRKNLFHTNVTTAFIKTGFHLFDYYFGSVINIHDELGRIVKQEPRIGQAAGTFNLIIGNTQSGKAEPLSAKIPTPQGWTTMGQIKVGSIIFNENGDPVSVRCVFPQGVMDVYELTLEDGRHVRCTLDHIWMCATGDTTASPLNFKIMPLRDFINDYQNWKIPALLDYVHYDQPIPERLTGNRVYLSISRIDYVGQEECQCIYIDSPFHLYLTDEFIVTHNTTLAAQISANIIRQFQYANVIHFDCENRFDVSRAETITQLPAKYFDPAYGERYMIKTGLVGLDVIQEMIVKTYVSKMKLKDQLLISSGFQDEFGKEVKIFQPTLIIIDSITTVLNETFNPDNAKEASDAEKMRSNTEGARDAKSLKGFFKDILPLLKEANIIVYGINHINSNVSMNAFTPVARQQNFLKQDESIPGGKTMLYYPFNIIKLTAKPSDDFNEEQDGFAGHVVSVEPIKSSSNQSGNNSKGISFQMVFSFKYGFDSLRTMILYGRDHGFIEGTRNRLKFRDDPSFTFTWKNLDDEKKEKPIWQSINKFIVPTLNEHLPFIEPNHVDFDDESLNY